MSDLLKVSSNPHIRSKDTTSRIMLYVIISLLPAAGFGVYNFGLHALAVIIVTIASTVLTEYIYDYGLGLQTEKVLKVMKMDMDYWDAMDNA